MAERTTRSRRIIRLSIVVAVVALGAAAFALNVVAKSGKSGPFAGQPFPTLFPTARLTPVRAPERTELTRARRDFTRWISTHPARDDAGFAAFALGHVGAPPTGKAQQDELTLLHRIDANRTPAAIAASVWLEAHGKKDVWKLYRKQSKDLVAPGVSAEEKARFNATYALAKTVADQGKNRFARPSPYLTDPTLHALNQSRFKKKFSYPSKHTVISYALTGVLSHYEPARAPEYRWMSEQISYSRLYAGGHYPSDVDAGEYLGDLIAEYELRFPPATKKS